MTISQVLDIVSPVHSEPLVASISLDTLPLPQLLYNCGKHLEHFRRGQKNDPQFCLELFRRALDRRDPDAWYGLVNLFQPLLLARLRRREIVPELAEEAVQEAFVTLWLKSYSSAVSTSDRTLAQVLHYLWQSVRFALIKLRRQQRDIPLSLEAEPGTLLTAPSSEAVERGLDAQALLARVRMLVTPGEWQILWLRFAQELPPREIATLLCTPVEEIHGALASIKRRLRNDSHLRNFMETDSQL